MEEAAKDSQEYQNYNPFNVRNQEWHHIIKSNAYAEFQTLYIPSVIELDGMYPMQNSWKEAKERNPNLTFREWDAQQGGRLCPGAGEIKDPEVERIFDRIASVDVPTTFFNNVHSERLANYAEQFFTESPCRKAPHPSVPFGSRLNYKDIKTNEQALWYLYMGALGYPSADNLRSSMALRNYFSASLVPATRLQCRINSERSLKILPCAVTNF